jgi:hypothetical protein
MSDQVEPKPLVDPTANVIALVQSNAAAAAGLRDADIKFNDATAAHIKEIGSLRAAHQETLRTSDLDRLDKTRQVDVLAASASAAALATAVQTLASTADRNADALRNLVNATAATMAKQTSDQAATLSAATDSLVKDINARIAELQKSSYQGVGKSSVADPMMAELIAEMRTLVKGRDVNTGKSEGMSDSAKLLIGALAVMTALLSAYTFTQQRGSAAAPAPVIYQLAPVAPLPTTPPR